MRRVQVSRFATPLVIALAAFLLAGGTVKATASVSCGIWSVVSSADAGGDDILYGAVTIPGTRQFWAVGRYDGSNGFYQSLVERWNGSRWSVVSSPNVANTYNILNGVAAVSAHDVQAVGYYLPGFFIPTFTLAESYC